MLLLSVAILISIQLVASQYIPAAANGTCPSFDKCRDQKLNLTAKDLAGIWYLFADIPFFFDEGYKCRWYNMSLKPNNDVHFDQHEYSL